MWRLLLVKVFSYSVALLQLAPIFAAQTVDIARTLTPDGQHRRTIVMQRRGRDRWIETQKRTARLMFRHLC
jgi:hypothetical protein